MKLADMYMGITPVTDEQKADAKMFFDHVRTSIERVREGHWPAHNPHTTFDLLCCMTHAEKFQYLYGSNGSTSYSLTTFIELRRPR